MSVRRDPRLCLRTLLTLALAGALLALSAVCASAKVVHHSEGRFLGGEAPGGGLGADLLSDAVDSSSGPSSGDVYVLETSFGGSGEDVVDKFTAAGVYAGVQITGAETGPHSFEFEALGSGVAVDSSLSADSGDVYIADTEHGVVDRFSEAGKFLCQIAGAETETATPATECDIAGSGLAAKMSPTGLAVDASGDVYVADDQHEQINEFGPEGHLIRSIHKKEGHLTNEMTTIALGSSGEIYVTNFASTVRELNAKGEFVTEFGELALGVAVNRGTSPNEVYVGEGPTLTEYEPSGALRSSTPLAGGASFFPAIAINQTNGKIYAAAAELIQEEEPHGVDILGPDIVLPDVATEAATSVEQTSAILHGTVEPDLVHGGGDVTSCQFEYVTEAAFQEHTSGPYEGAAVAPCASPPSLPYSTPEAVKAAVTLSASTTYHFRLVAADAGGSNDGEGEAKPEATLTTVGPPTIETESASALTHSATFAAQINPRGFAATCQLQYVDAADFTATGYQHATTVPCPQALGAGITAQSASVTVTGLAIGTVYHYRFLASNSAGPATGLDHTTATFGVSSFSVEALDREGHPYTQAGGHPYDLRTDFALSGGGLAEANIKDVETALPAGLIGNPTATAKCTREQLTNFQCSGAAQVGLLTLFLHEGEFNDEPVYNLVPPPGVPAEFGTRFNTFTNVYIDANVRTGGDYGVTATVTNASAAAGVVGAEVEFWGVPGDSSHDAKRFCPTARAGEPERNPCTTNIQPLPFLRNPTSCAGPRTASIAVDAWQAQGEFVRESAPMPAITGCESLSFGAAATLQPDTSQADSPSGLQFSLMTNQSELASGLADADLRESSVSLPTGMSVNPAGANGLQACSPGEIALNSAATPSCPSASKIGTVEIDTPLLTAPLTGSVYVAEQDNNPFDSLLALYVVAEADGALVKLAGHVEANQETGQLTTTFENLPQVPFNELKLNLFSGAHASLATPENCGTFTTNTLWGPWSAGAPIASPSSFQITSACFAGFTPSFQAGTVSPTAGAFSPFELSFSRTDAEQEPSGISATLPAGLLANIASVPLCSEADANAGTCPQASQIGTVETSAGVGPEPVFLPGKVYLTGSYKGAPYGESVVVPAIAGPYNLGNVIVRGAIRIDPVTAQATIVSDPFPTILQGIPVKLRSVAVTIDRPDFTFNSTSCQATSVTGTLLATGGASAAVSSPYQVGGCGELPFSPKLTASVTGPGSKVNGVAFTVHVAAKQGPQTSSAVRPEANIHKVEVQLPVALPSRLTTLQRACTEQQFAANPAGCPDASRVGTAVAHTPILASPLEGPAYIVSHAAAAFPDVVLVLQGDGITVELTGHTQIKKGITYSRFETLPDAPISSFSLTLPAKPFSLISGNNLCAPVHTTLVRRRVTVRVHGHVRHVVRTVAEHVPAPLNMPTTITAQSGATLRQTTQIALSGCTRSKAAAAKRHR